MSLASDKALAEDLLGTSIDMLEARNLEIFALRAQRNELLETLRELTALVRGECPSLLNEDSGGDARLSLRIDALLTSAQPRESA